MANPSPFHLQSLKSRITVAALFVILAGMWTLSLLATRILRLDMEQMLGDQQYATVSMLATHINGELDSRSRALTSAALSIGPEFLADTAAVQQFLDSRTTLQTMFNAGLIITDQTGRVRAGYPSTAGIRIGSSLADDNGVTIALRAGQPAISQPFQGGTSKTPVFSQSVPLFDADKRIVGTLSGFTDLSLPNFFDLLSKNRYGRTGLYLLVSPRDRLVITSSDPERIMESISPAGEDADVDDFLSERKTTAVFNSRCSQGEEVLGSCKRIPFADWMVCAQLPTAEAFVPIRDMQRRMMYATIIASLFSFLLIGWMLRKQLRPLETATQKLADLAPDQLPDQPLPVARDDEVGQLIARFNNILEALREREERLQMLYDSSFGGININDEGRIVECNRGLLEMTNYSRDELLALEKYALVAPECRDAVKAYVRSGNRRPYDTVGLRKDGTRYHLRLLGKDIVYRGKTLRMAEFQDISESKEAERALRQSEESFRNFFEKNSSVFLLFDPFSREIISANEAACAYYGYSKAQLLGMQTDAINTLSVNKLGDYYLSVLNGERRVVEFTHRLASGELRNVECHITIFEQSWRPMLLSIIHDITERKQAEKKLQLAASVFSHAREGIMITQADGTIIDINESFTRITGYSSADAIGRTPRLLKSDRQSPDFYAAMWDSLIRKGHWYGEIWNRHKDGQLFATLQTISTVFDAEKVPQHHVALFSDITTLKEHANQLEHIAHYDILTTLPNRVLLADRMKQAMVQAERRNQLLAVIYLDLDGFKAINDLYGHETGDRLLIELSQRIKQSLRESDTLARLGGDEFVAVLMDLKETSLCTPMIERLLSAAASPVKMGGLTLSISASIGVTFFPQNDEVDADQLLRQADQAMYQAKLAGKNRYHLFDAEQDRNARGHHESLEHIRRGLLTDQFVLYYQPKVNMRSGAIIGAEVLIRWQHPERGLLPPDMFLPEVEDHPLAIEIGEWVIDTALRQMEDWQQQELILPISINVGARQLLHGNFHQRLRAILAAHPTVLPANIEIEILETSAIEDLARVSQIIKDCQEIGVRFAIDDFGTGYSSLTYLRRLSVDQLKIDKSFVRDMLDDTDDLSILSGVLSMASAFQRQVIAEGVETIEHGTMLLQLGCELAQGYGIARPMPAADLPAWVSAWRPNRAWNTTRPARRDDLPLVFAGVEHHAWISSVEKYLSGDLATPAQPQYRFGDWLNREGQALYRDRVTFQAILKQHRAVTETANWLCQTSAMLSPETRQFWIAELRQQSGILRSLLQTLITENHQPVIDIDNTDQPDHSG